MPHEIGRTPSNHHSVALAERVICDGGERLVRLEQTWVRGALRFVRCEGCGQAVGIWRSGWQLRTLAHFRTDLAR